MTTAGPYVEGQTVRIKTATPFQTADGTPTDPTTVTLRVRTPSGTITVYTYGAAEITKVATGDYYKDLTVAESGTYVYRWEGAGNVTAVDEDSFFVAASAIV
jgi:hypothetical protein